MRLAGELLDSRLLGQLQNGGQAHEGSGGLAGRIFADDDDFPAEKNERTVHVASGQPSTQWGRRPAAIGDIAARQCPSADVRSKRVWGEDSRKPP